MHEASPTEIYTLSLHDALPICIEGMRGGLFTIFPYIDNRRLAAAVERTPARREEIPQWAVEAIGMAQLNLWLRSEEHTSELQSRVDLVCRLLLEKKNKKSDTII